MQLRSADGTRTVATDLPRGAFVTGGSATAEIYLTDLAKDKLDPSMAFDALSGQITHISLFLPPRAGRTPMDDAACTATLRHVIFNRGEVGIYAGGGFVRADAPGDGLWSGVIHGTFAEATLRPGAATPGFVDQLGPGTIEGRFQASEDPRLAYLLAARLREALSRAMPVSDKAAAR